MNTVFLGLGSNLGEKENNILKAYELISSQIADIQSKSSFYYSEAWGFESENSFVNSVIQIETSLEPLHLLDKLKEIENEIGRIQKSSNQHYKDRIIDVDILFFNNDIINNNDLSIPHPFINQRLFVLEPLNEIASELRHPILNLKVSELLSSLKN